MAEMDESKRETGRQPEQSGAECAAENEKGDFTLDELMRSHQRNLDAQRPVAPLRRVKNGQE